MSRSQVDETQRVRLMTAHLNTNPALSSVLNDSSDHKAISTVISSMLAPSEDSRYEGAREACRVPRAEKDCIVSVLLFVEKKKINGLGIAELNGGNAKKLKKKLHP